MRKINLFGSAIIQFKLIIDDNALNSTKQNDTIRASFKLKFKLLYLIFTSFFCKELLLTEKPFYFKIQIMLIFFKDFAIYNIHFFTQYNYYALVYSMPQMYNSYEIVDWRIKLKANYTNQLKKIALNKDNKILANIKYSTI